MKLDALIVGLTIMYLMLHLISDFWYSVTYNMRRHRVWRVVFFSIFFAFACLGFAGTITNVLPLLWSQP